jgi:X-Pro dipeptidyl-peptidase (S15 family)
MVDLTSVREFENVWITLSDGCKLAARIWVPQNAASAPVPAILEYIPYRKRDYMRRRDESMHHPWFASHGYAAVRVDWWDRWLKGVANDVMEEPAHRFHMMESVGPVSHLEHRPGRWVAENTARPGTFRRALSTPGLRRPTAASHGCHGDLVQSGRSGVG